MAKVCRNWSGQKSRKFAVRKLRSEYQPGGWREFFQNQEQKVFGIEPGGAGFGLPGA
jgi:hypothetical protein